MSPVQPHWQRPSHPEIQEVFINEENFSTRSVSKVNLPPFGLFAKMTYPPCTVIDKPSYASVQSGKNEHFLLNSDLMYINHSCEPSLIFDTGNSIITAGPNGLKEGEELTFFYPSTEWDMAQSFTCLCKAPTCRGLISGAKDMTTKQLDGLWLNGHIRELLEEQQALQSTTTNGHKSTATTAKADDATALALKDALSHAEKVVAAARKALNSYMASPSAQVEASGATRRGPTSRELSGEMGGDTIVAH